MYYMFHNSQSHCQCGGSLEMRMFSEMYWLQTPDKSLDNKLLLDLLAEGRVPLASVGTHISSTGT